MQPEQPVMWFAIADVEAARQRLADNRYGGPNALHDLDEDDVTEIIRIVLTATWQRARQEGLAEGMERAVKAIEAESETDGEFYRFVIFGEAGGSDA